MNAKILEIFRSIQGEGKYAGAAQVFVRFFECNMHCVWCDTPASIGDGKHAYQEMGLEEALRQVHALYDHVHSVSITGGEPLLQLDTALIEALHQRGFEVAVETNGTLTAPAGLDWICVSPKATAPLLLRQGQELKLVYPQVEPQSQPERFVHLDFQYFFLQPLDDLRLRENTLAALRYCLEHPQWRLSLQLQKILNIP